MLRYAIITAALFCLPAAAYSQGITPGGSTSLTTTANPTEGQLGFVGGYGVILDLTPVVDTTTYAADETLFSTITLTAAGRVNGGRVYLQSLTILDEADQGQPLDLIFLNLSTTLGATNAACAVTDTNARQIIGRVQIGASDFYDLGGSRVASISGLGLMMTCTSGTTALYMSAISRGTPLYGAATDLKIKAAFTGD